jgi:hypothetical protein
MDHAHDGRIDELVKISAAPHDGVIPFLAAGGFTGLAITM